MKNSILHYLLTRESHSRKCSCSMMEPAAWATNIFWKKKNGWWTNTSYHQIIYNVAAIVIWWKFRVSLQCTNSRWRHIRVRNVRLFIYTGCENAECFLSFPHICFSCGGFASTQLRVRCIRTVNKCIVYFHLIWSHAKRTLYIVGESIWFVLMHLNTLYSDGISDGSTRNTHYVKWRWRACFSVHGK